MGATATELDEDAPDAELKRHYPEIDEEWFKERLLLAAGPNAEHYNRWAAKVLGDYMGESLSESVLTRRLKGRKKWPAEFVSALAWLLKVDEKEIIRRLGARTSRRKNK